MYIIYIYIYIYIYITFHTNPSRGMRTVLVYTLRDVDCNFTANDNFISSSVFASLNVGTKVKQP
jgi:hypothetical protein